MANILIDPSASIYTPKTDTVRKPNWVADTQAIQAWDANQIRQALLDLRQGVIDVSGTSGAFYASELQALSSSYYGQGVSGSGLSASFDLLSASYYPLSASYYSWSGSMSGALALLSATVETLEGPAMLAISQSLTTLQQEFTTCSGNFTASQLQYAVDSGSWNAADIMLATLAGNLLTSIVGIYAASGSQSTSFDARINATTQSLNAVSQSFDDHLFASRPGYAGLYHSGTAITDPTMNIVAGVWSTLSGDLIHGAHDPYGIVVSDVTSGTLRCNLAGHYVVTAIASIESSANRLIHLGFGTGSAPGTWIPTEIYDAAQDVGTNNTVQLQAHGILSMSAGNYIAARVQADGNCVITMHHLNFTAVKLS
jgi:hypothetical protein